MPTQMRFPQVVELEKFLIWVEVREKRNNFDRLFCERWEEPLKTKHVPIEKNGHIAGFWDFPDLSQPNEDIPDNLQFYDMGLTQRVNEHLDHRAMDDRDFRERCVQINGRNYALYLKGKADLQPPQHQRFEWLTRLLGITEDIAIKLTRVFNDLALDRKVVMKVLYGYVRSDGIRTSGLIGHKGNVEKIAELVDELEQTATAITEPDWKWIDDPMNRSYDGSVPEWGIYLTDEVLAEINPDMFVAYDEDTNLERTDDQLDVTGANNPFGAHPLHWGNEALSHEFISNIKEADSAKLVQITKGFYPQPNPYTGKLNRAKYHYLTPSQKAQAWVYIKARREELKAQVKAHLSPDANMALNWVRSLGRGNIAASLIYAFAEGRAYDLFGEKIEFKQKPRPEEVQVVWDEYKQIANQERSLP